MKKILVLARRDDRPDYDRKQSMLEGLGVTNDTSSYYGADYEDLVFFYDGNELRITDAQSGMDIRDFDTIFMIGWFKYKALEDVARAVSYYAKSFNIPFANSEVYYGRSLTKVSQCVMAAINGIQVTPFIFCLDQEVLLDRVRDVQWPCPLIVKAVSASRGKDNYLIEDISGLRSAIDQESEAPRYFIVQKFIPNDGDYRILVMGGKVKRVIHRRAVGATHLNNTSQGGEATLVDLAILPSAVLEAAELIAAKLRREVTGVDMIQHKDTGEYFFLEANNMPQLATGSFVSEKMSALREYLDGVNSD